MLNEGPLLDYPIYVFNNYSPEAMQILADIYLAFGLVNIRQYSLSVRQIIIEMWTSKSKKKGLKLDKQHKK